MKKSLFMLGAAIVALSSCTQDEVLNVNENRVISFESHVNKNTRAVTETTADLKQFFVFGYYGTTPVSVFENVAVADDVETTVLWTAASDYYFAAYATANTSVKKNNVTFAEGKLTFADYAVTDTEDLVAAVTPKIDNSSMTQSTVDLDFKHMLSKVAFELTNGSSNYKMRVADITFDVNTKGKCVYDGTNVVWSEWSTPAALTYAGATIDETEKYSVEHLVIPTAIPGDLKVNISVEFLDGANVVSQKTFNNVELAKTVTDWLPGTVYKYTAAINATTANITFNVKTVAGWANGADTTL